MTFTEATLSFGGFRISSERREGPPDNILPEAVPSRQALEALPLATIEESPVEVLPLFESMGSPPPEVNAPSLVGGGFIYECAFYAGFGDSLPVEAVALTGKDGQPESRFYQLTSAGREFSAGTVPDKIMAIYGFYADWDDLHQQTQEFLDRKGLTAVDGIGPAIARHLKANRISNLAELSQASKAEIANLFPGKAGRYYREQVATWIAQAQETLELRPVMRNLANEFKVADLLFAGPEAIGSPQDLLNRVGEYFEANGDRFITQGRRNRKLTAEGQRFGRAVYNWLGRRFAGATAEQIDLALTSTLGETVATRLLRRSLHGQQNWARKQEKAKALGLNPEQLLQPLYLETGTLTGAPALQYRLKRAIEAAEAETGHVPIEKETKKFMQLLAEEATYLRREVEKDFANLGLELTNRLKQGWRKLTAPLRRRILPPLFATMAVACLVPSALFFFSTLDTKPASADEMETASRRARAGQMEAGVNFDRLSTLRQPEAVQTFSANLVTPRASIAGGTTPPRPIEVREQPASPIIERLKVEDNDPFTLQIGKKTHKLFIREKNHNYDDVQITGSDRPGQALFFSVHSGTNQETGEPLPGAELIQVLELGKRKEIVFTVRGKKMRFIPVDEKPVIFMSHDRFFGAGDYSQPITYGEVLELAPAYFLSGEYAPGEYGQPVGIFTCAKWNGSEYEDEAIMFGWLVPVDQE